MAVNYRAQGQGHYKNKGSGEVAAAKCCPISVMTLPVCCTECKEKSRILFCSVLFVIPRRYPQGILRKTSQNPTRFYPWQGAL